MKPDQEMRADMEEPDLEPCDLFVDFGMLVVEGRIPGLSGRGYGEGPHCPKLGGQMKHNCNPQDAQCIRNEQFRKHMLLLWRNNIPMSIEVLFSPENTSLKNQDVESLNVPEPSYVLLEQWTIQMLPKRVPDVVITGKSLMHAVRSYLHFSQLSAWYSLSAGKIPQNVVYRICVPGEAFSNKFTSSPDTHSFPIANIGRSNAMKVTVKAIPRCTGIPSFLTQKRDRTEKATKDNEANKMNMACALIPEDLVLSFSDDSSGNESSKYRREGSPETLLGDSLLDPPQSLQMYPKRYQSPSRSGSPVMEAPEHLMCRAASNRDQLDGMRVVSGFDGRYERSRSRRPFERCLMGNGNSSSSSKLFVDPSMSNPPMANLGKVLPTASEQGVIDDGSSSKVAKGNSRCFAGFALTPKETEEVLNLLHRRNFGVSSCKTRTKNPENSNYSCSSAEVYNLKGKNETQVWNTKEISCRENLPVDNSTRKSSETLNDQVDCNSNPKEFSRFHNKHFQIVDNKKTLTNFQIKREKVLTQKNKQNDNDGVAIYERKLTSSDKKSVTRSSNNNYNDNDNEDSDDDKLKKKKSENATRKSFNCDLMREILQKQLSTFKETNNNLDGNVNRIIPTANDKAKFRRSLDSATSMVFHCKTGLPLTSSPAPLRKGTCFDFDSTLTSVTAIKNALFEKDEKKVILEDNKNLSFSAPASVTNNSLLGSFEESVLNGRLEPVSTVEGFTAEIGASGSFCPRHITVPVTVFFYTLSDTDKVSTPYLGHINLGPKGYHVPKKGTIQVTLFNPHGTVVKMFVIMYDLSDMPVNCQTFLRQRTLYMPVGAKDEDPQASQWLRYLVHLRFASSKSGRIYLHTDMRMVIFRKSDMDAATILGTYELRSFTRGPTNPKFSPIR